MLFHCEKSGRAAAERAHAISPADLFINTTLSRIWMERGDEAGAEHFGAQAKIQSRKEQLQSPAGEKQGKRFALLPWQVPVHFRAFL